MATCSIAGCDRLAVARSWCATHYKRWQKWGDTSAVHTNRAERNGRWEGDRATDNSARERCQRRFPLTLCEHEGCTAPATDRHHVDGKPHNNAAVNVRLLCRRHHMEEDGRLASLVARNCVQTPRGEAHWRTRLTADDVRAIRSVGSSMTQVALAERFGVSTSAIRHILAGRSWRPR